MIAATFASVSSAITPSDATRRLTRSADARASADLISRCCGTLSASGAISRIASTGTTQRATEKAPPALAGPVMNFPGSVA